jgi:UDP-2,3-diacylglucosamine pyrophosphatase LpxH
MSISKKLDQALAHSHIMEIGDSFKGLFISDLHMGLGDDPDDFKSNAGMCLSVLKRHVAEGFRIFLLGDGYELWENPNYEAIRHAYPEICSLLTFRADRLSGNHDQELFLPQAYVLRYKETGRKILILHGHQGNFFCDEGYPLGRFFVRNIWRNLQLIGFRDPTTAMKDKNPKKHEGTREAFHDWAFSRKQTVIFGHTHFAESDPPYYWNTGSWVGEGGHGVVVEGDRISLKTFS